MVNFLGVIFKNFRKCLIWYLMRVILREREIELGFFYSRIVANVGQMYYIIREVFSGKEKTHLSEPDRSDLYGVDLLHQV